VLETRPDHLPPREVERLRRLGATKIQIGVQSLSDRVLAANRRGHDVAATRRAIARLRRAGFKLHLHWMPNLLGSDPERDRADFERLFTDPGVRPDELKVYPCSLIESAELMRHYEDGSWRPYGEEELLDLLCDCLAAVPPYCRVTRMIRDIPGDEIHAGNRITNFRQLVERELRRRGRPSRDIRAREIGGRPVDPEELRLDRVEYRSTVGRELFLQMVTEEDRIVGFCRLTLPEPTSSERTLSETSAEIPEVAGAALLREVHVYGAVVAIGDRDDGRAQHLGLGRRLVAEAAEVARAAGYPRLAVISAVGTRDYYRGLGFTDGELYQHLDLTRGAIRSTTTAPPG
jgi:elongator complex protein 3